MAKILGSFIENTNTTMVEIAHRIGYSHDLSQQRRLVNTELLKLPMSNTQRLMAASMIVKDEDKVDLFFSLDENDKMEWVSLLLEGIDDTGTTSSRKKGKPRRFWNHREELFLITTMKDVTARYQMQRGCETGHSCSMKIGLFYLERIRRLVNQLRILLILADAILTMEKENANATTEEGE
ncbi:hypothetical protein LOK49_LG07G02065 [Camellia lanceoleosa]|uniref:Uncharacterized protein n=1 Tax=Camellia lanceoleosa TaxID=1840588 RepID=A0ACC0H3N9_9ERIC|nr:hypothetical protein LOK49_LG07G02065 [Camellia lanceoleosa]